MFRPASLPGSNQLEIAADVKAVPRRDFVLLERLLRHRLVLHEHVAVRLAHEAALGRAVDHLRRRRALAGVDAGGRDVARFTPGRRRGFSAHVRVVAPARLGSRARLCARALRVASAAIARSAVGCPLPRNAGDLRDRHDVDLDPGHQARAGLAGLIPPAALLASGPPRKARDLALAIGAALPLAPDDFFEVAQALEQLPLLLLAHRLARHPLHVFGALLDVLGALAEGLLELPRRLCELPIELAHLARGRLGLGLVTLQPFELPAIVGHRRIGLGSLRVLSVLAEQTLAFRLELAAARFDGLKAFAARTARLLHGLAQPGELRRARLLVLALEPLGELPKCLLGIFEPPFLERLGGGPGEPAPLQPARDAVEPELPRFALRLERPAEVGIELGKAGQRLFPIEASRGDVLH